MPFPYGDKSQRVGAGRDSTEGLMSGTRLGWDVREKEADEVRAEGGG